MRSETQPAVETRSCEGSPTPSFNFASLGAWSPISGSPESDADESREGSPPGLDVVSPLSWLECISSSPKSDDPIYVCVSPSSDCSSGLQLSERPQEEDCTVFPDELQEAYSTGTFHSLFWKLVAPEEQQVSHEWKGHRPLDPAYPVALSRQIHPRRRRFASRTPPKSFSVGIPVLTHAIHTSPDDNNFEIVLHRVCRLCDTRVISSRRERNSILRLALCRDSQFLSL
jgi:hypothetical protein